LTLHLVVESAVGTVHADERKIKQVMFNLLSNAVRFTPPGGRIDVRAWSAEDGGPILISVRDTGVGIAPDEQVRVFEEFYQAAREPERTRDGTGLGLALARKFVELHGGRLWVESQPGQGSLFTFTLPRDGRRSPIELEPNGGPSSVSQTLAPL
jgi:signal transduction histidine kinase